MALVQTVGMEVGNLGIELWALSKRSCTLLTNVQGKEISGVERRKEEGEEEEEEGGGGGGGGGGGEEEEEEEEKEEEEEGGGEGRDGRRRGGDRGAGVEEEEINIYLFGTVMIDSPSSPRVC